MIAAAASTHTSWPANGQTMPIANSPAPSGGPTRLLSVMKPAKTRALAIPRSGFPTSIGMIVAELVSTNTSQVPRQKTATSTIQIVTCPVARNVTRTASSPARATLPTAISHRRSTRSATTPAYSPNSSHGSCWSSSAIATRNGSWVWEATSSGPAARPSPSARLLAHDAATFLRNS